MRKHLVHLVHPKGGNYCDLPNSDHTGFFNKTTCIRCLQLALDNLPDKPKHPFVIETKNNLEARIKELNNE
jgi:hypothetical protein